MLSIEEKREHGRLAQAKYKSKNIDKVRERNRLCMAKYRVTHEQECKEYQREYRKNNIEIIKERSKIWIQEHPELKRQKRWKYKAMKKLSTVGETNIQQLISTWDKVCSICSEMVDGSFHIDHIIPLSKGGKHEQSNLQLVHPLCNMRKGNRI